jgi:hypothetical protein
MHVVLNNNGANTYELYFGFSIGVSLIPKWSEKPLVNITGYKACLGVVLITNETAAVDCY